MNLIGQRFGNLLVVDKADKRGYHFVYKVRCDCDKHTEVYQANLRKGATKSCGCKRIPHGHYKGDIPTKTYNSWQGMKKRCYVMNHHRYHLYGKRGIKVCKRWLDSFENFLYDMGERPEGKTLDRIDNNGNYELINCKWSTPKEQANNRRRRKNAEIGVTK